MQWQQQQAPQQQAQQKPAAGGVAGGFGYAASTPAPAPATAAAEAGAAKTPPSTQMVTVPPQGAVNEVNGASTQVEIARVEVQSAAPPVAGDDLRVDKAKPADTVEVPAAPATITDSSGTPQPKYARNMRVAPLAPRWTVSATGALQRSFDQGNSWEAVDVNPDYSGRALGLLTLAPAQTADMKANNVPANNSQTNATQANSAQKNTNSNANVINSETRAAKQNVPTVFRAVVAMGSEVWAGGSGGALFHSYDAGNHWSRVVPVSAGMPLTSDIVAIEFSDLQHGRITTSAAEIWTTVDDGQTWQKH
jgi:hypothetical protein